MSTVSEREQLRRKVKEVLAKQPTPDTMTPEELKRALTTEKQFFQRLTRPHKRTPYRFNPAIRGKSPQI